MNEDQHAQGVAGSNRVQVRDADGNFLFRTEWLAQYVIIDGPGSYDNIVVTSTPQLYNPVDYGEEGNSRYIVNLKAVLKENLPKLAKMLANAEYVRADELKGLFLNATIWVDQETGAIPTLPHKRQKVSVNVDYVPSQDGDEEVLRITDIFIQPGKTAPKVDMTAFLALAESGAE